MDQGAPVSIKIMTLVWTLPLPDSQKIVMLALADCANDEGICWPSMASLVRKTSKSERTVQGVIKQLCEAGHLSREERPGRGCVYTVHPRTDCAPQPLRPADPAPPQPLPQTPAAAADKPSRTTNNGLSDDKPKRARKAKPAIPDWIPAEAWDGFLEMRKRMGKPPTDRAIDLMIGKLERWRAQGHDPGEILNTSTECNWTGLFEPKDRKNGQNSRVSKPTTRQIGERVAARFAAGGGSPADIVPRLGSPGWYDG